MTRISYIYRAPAAREERISLAERIDRMSDGKRAVVIGIAMGLLLWIPVLLWVAMG